jgi:hypothetical protein
LGDNAIGNDLLDLTFRLERKFGIKVSREQLAKMASQNEPADIKVGQLFEFLRGQVYLVGVLDVEMDAEAVWLIYQREISDALGVEPDEVTKDQGLIYDLGAQ